MTVERPPASECSRVRALTTCATELPSPASGIGTCARCGGEDIGVSVASRPGEHGGFGGADPLRPPRAQPVPSCTGRVGYGLVRECCAPHDDRRLDPDPGPAR